MYKLPSHRSSYDCDKKTYVGYPSVCNRFEIHLENRQRLTKVQSKVIYIKDSSRELLITIHNQPSEKSTSRVNELFSLNAIEETPIHPNARNLNL